MLRRCFVSALLLAMAAGVCIAKQPTIGCGVRGTVTDESGAPIPGLFLTAYSSMVQQGHRSIVIAGSATTDDSGAYCMHILMRAPLPVGRVTPGPPLPPASAPPVFVIAAQWFNFKQPNATRAGTPPTWYPGVPDFASAKPVMPGPDARADFKLSTQRTLTISGTLTRLPAQDEIEKSDEWSETPEGIRVQNGVIEMDNARKTFTISGAFPGDWTFVFRIVTEEKIFEARLRKTIDGDIHDAVMALSSSVHIKVEVNGQPYQPNDGDFFVMPYKAGGAHNGPGGPFMTVFPGAYKLIIPPVMGPGPFQCVESFSPGDIPIENGNLIVSSQQHKQPISFYVGGHCASLTVKLPKGGPPMVSILIVPESLPFQPLPGAPERYASTIYYPWPLSPGTYKVYAFTTLEGLEYENPAVMSRFSGQSVTLEPDKKTEVTLDVVNAAQ